MESQQLEKIFSSQLSEVKLVVNETLAFLKEKKPNLSDTDYFEFKLIYSELLCNAVIHGNGHEQNKKVSVMTQILEDGTVSAEITDEGIGFNLDDILLSQSIFNEHGRGIFIAKNLADEFTANCLENGNHITFKKKVSP